MKSKFQPAVWGLLRQNISRTQMAGYALANIVGLSVVLIGILFYCDSQNDKSHEDKFFSDDYVVLSKRVDGIGFTPTGFSEEEIDSLGSQPWVRKVGRFTASLFAVRGAVNIGGMELSTYLFCESVPDEFFDVKPTKWKFDPEEKFVPIVLSKDYLTLYNFGFAIPQGLPQVSEELVGDIPIELRLTGEGMQPEYFEAAVVGFSSRLNTIAVPQSFMDWANKRYAGGETQPTSRLIAKVDRLESAEMDKYLEARSIEVAGDKQEAGKISKFLGVVSTVVAANGVVICALAIFILVLSIFLLLQKSRDKLRNLMLLGYHPLYVARYYEAVVVATNVAVTLLSLAVAFVVRESWRGGLEDVGLGQASLLPVVSFALAYVVGVTLFDIFVIRSRMLSIWKDA